MEDPASYPAPSRPTSEVDAAIRARGVGVYRNGRWILKDVDWTVPAGSCVAVLGPNGSGKSTLTRVISGYMWPTDGDLWVLGERFGSVNLHELRESLRLVQPTGLAEPDAEATAFDVALTGAFGTVGLYGHVDDATLAEAERLLTAVGLRSVFNTPYQNLSSGERIRCLIARAMVRKPRLLLLDEPSLGLSPLLTTEVLDRVRDIAAAGTSVLLAEQNVHKALAVSDRAYVIKLGRIVRAADSADLLASTDLAEAFLGA